MAQGDEELLALAGREIELPRRAIHYICGDDAVHFFTEGLNRDCFPCQLPTFVAFGHARVSKCVCVCVCVRYSYKAP